LPIWTATTGLRRFWHGLSVTAHVDLDKKQESKR
jgi:hypothetical protein